MDPEVNWGAALWISLGFLFYALLDFIRDFNKPGARSAWPVVGILPGVTQNFYRIRDYQLGLVRRAIKAGHSVWFWKLPGMRGWCLFNPEDIEHILKTRVSNYHIKPLRAQFLAELLGDGIFNNDGEMWRLQRKTASHEFSQGRFKTFMIDVFQLHAQRLLEQLDKARGVVDLQNYFSRYTMDSIAKIAFGRELHSIEQEDEAFTAAFNGVTKIAFARSLDPFLRIRKLFPGFGREAKMWEQIRVIDSIVEDVIKGLRSKTEEEIEQELNILARFMIAQKDVHMVGVTPAKFLRDVVTNFILAGRDTTSNCLSWLTFSVATHPKVEERLVAEIRSAQQADMGEAGKWVPSFDALKNMHYLQSVVSETLRLYPSVPDDPKIAVEDDVLPSGFLVKAGEIAHYVPWVMGRLPQLWGEDCEEFKPERWLTPAGVYKKESPFKFTAFQAGPRTCLGIDMAQLEVKTMAAMLYDRFHVTVREPEKVTYDVDLTLPMKDGLFCELTPRF